jgi:zinc resistance-associated protein
MLPMLMVALLVISVGTAMAGPGGRGMGMGPGYGLGPYAYGSANLTPEKAAQLQSLYVSFQKDISPLQNELFAKRMEMRTLWTSANPDAAQIAALQKDILALQGQIQEKRLQFNLEARKLLNP